MEKLKNVWLWIVGGIAALIAALFYQRSKRQEAESKLEHAEYDKASAITSEKNSQLEAKKEEIKEEAKEEKVKELTPEELLELLKKI